MKFSMVKGSLIWVFKRFCFSKGDSKKNLPDPGKDHKEVVKKLGLLFCFCCCWKFAFPSLSMR